MGNYIATFFSHFGAMVFKKKCDGEGYPAVIMPVPRSLSSSCGTCVRFEAEGEFPEKNEETEQIVRVEKDEYICIFHAEE